MNVKEAAYALSEMFPSCNIKMGEGALRMSIMVEPDISVSKSLSGFEKDVMLELISTYKSIEISILKCGIVSVEMSLYDSDFEIEIDASNHPHPLIDFDRIEKSHKNADIWPCDSVIRDMIFEIAENDDTKPVENQFAWRGLKQICNSIFDQIKKCGVEYDVSYEGVAEFLFLSDGSDVSVSISNLVFRSFIEAISVCDSVDVGCYQSDGAVGMSISFVLD